MNIIDKWIEALRSGEYKQGKLRLRDKHDQFCCFGVLCDLVGGEWKFQEGTGYYFHRDGKIDSTRAPPEMLNELGINGVLESALIGMNDSGMSFDAIASHIESHSLPRNRRNG